MVRGRDRSIGVAQSLLAAERRERRGGSLAAIFAAVSGADRPDDRAAHRSGVLRQARVDPDLESVVWPNRYDLAPDVLIWGVDAEGNLLASPESAKEDV